jgi:hypothetical protein
MLRRYTGNGCVMRNTLCSSRNVLLASLAMLCSIATNAHAANGARDEEDPFGEQEHVRAFVQTGGDLSREHRVRFTFHFDCPKTRGRTALHFAGNLQRLGFQEVIAKPCTGRDDCWQVAASKTMKISSDNMMYLTRQLDRLADVDDGRYVAWKAETVDKEPVRLSDSSDPDPSAGTPVDMPPAIRSMH